MLNLYSHFAIDDQFERMAPSLVFFFMLVCRMVVDWQFDKIPEEPKVPIFYNFHPEKTNTQGGGCPRGGQLRRGASSSVTAAAGKEQEGLVPAGKRKASLHLGMDRSASLEKKSQLSDGEDSEDRWQDH